jgi:hypothetical protein
MQDAEMQKDAAALEPEYWRRSGDSLCLNKTGPRDAMGRPMLRDGLERGAPKFRFEGARYLALEILIKIFSYIHFGTNCAEEDVEELAKARSDCVENELSYNFVRNTLLVWKRDVVESCKNALNDDIVAFDLLIAKQAPRAHLHEIRCLVWSKLFNTLEFCVGRLTVDWPHNFAEEVPTGDYHTARNLYIKTCAEALAQQIYAELGPGQLGPRRHGIGFFVPSNTARRQADHLAVGLALTQCPREYSYNGVWTARAIGQWLENHPLVLEKHAEVLALYKAQLDASRVHCKACEVAVEFSTSGYGAVFFLHALAKKEPGIMELDGSEGGE